MQRRWRNNGRAAGTCPRCDGWPRAGAGCPPGSGRSSSASCRCRWCGLNVYPSDIEAVLSLHPAVQLSAVIGVPDDKVGEEVAAAVVLKPGVEATIDEIAEFVKERVAAYKYPRIVWIVGDLPLGPTGKVLKRAFDRSVAGRTAGHSR